MYKSLTDSTRKFYVRNAIRSTKKGDEGIVGRPEYPATSLDWQGEAWYRVMGDAGTRIPEYPFTSVQSIGCGQVYCNTCCPGYLPSGSHPQTPGELVNNVTVCFNCDGDICNYKILNAVKIRHCGDYFVYHLTQLYGQNYRYCTE